MFSAKRIGRKRSERRAAPMLARTRIDNNCSLGKSAGHLERLRSPTIRAFELV